jgi:hypothetical protein
LNAFRNIVWFNGALQVETEYLAFSDNRFLELSDYASFSLLLELKFRATKSDQVECPKAYSISLGDESDQEFSLLDMRFIWRSPMSCAARQHGDPWNTLHHFNQRL